MKLDLERKLFVGDHGSLILKDNDEVAMKMGMLLEGECEGLGPLRAAAKYGYTKQRYFQVRQLYLEGGTVALANKTRGPKSKYRRTDEVIRLVIRHRFLDPQASPEVIAQKLRQAGYTISTRSVQRVIEQYGLQKKTL